MYPPFLLSVLRRRAHRFKWLGCPDQGTLKVLRSFLFYRQAKTPRVQAPISIPFHSPPPLLRNLYIFIKGFQKFHKKYLAQRNVESKNSLIQKCLVQKNYRSKIICHPQKILVQQNSGSKDFGIRRNFGSTKCLVDLKLK